MRNLYKKTILKDGIDKQRKTLSIREQEIMKHLTLGASNKAIAKSLRVTINAVEKHLSNIYKKLGITSRTEAVLWWLEKGTDFRN